MPNNIEDGQSIKRIDNGFNGNCPKTLIMFVTDSQKG